MSNSFAGRFRAVLGERRGGGVSKLPAEIDARDELYGEAEWSIYGPNGRAVRAFLDHRGPQRQRK
jgi:hypothetical protein